MRGTAGLVAAAAIAVGSLAACGEGASTERAAEQPPAAQQATDAPPAEPVLVGSHASVPTEPASVFADIATAPEAAERARQRFGLTGAAPATDFGTSALLFLGFGESGSCPARFDDLTVDGSRVDVAVGTDGGPMCTDDYRPRTFVVEVARGALPEGGFELAFQGRSFGLASVPVPAPPPGPAMVAQLTAEQPQLELVAEPSSVRAGRSDAPIELLLRNDGDVSAGTGAGPMTLQRWDAQRWLPAAGQPVYQDHPSIDAVPVEVAPGQRDPVATVTAGGLQPGWYGVLATLQLGGRGGVAEVRSVFEVTEAR